MPENPKGRNPPLPLPEPTSLADRFQLWKFILKAPAITTNNTTNKFITVIIVCNLIDSLTPIASKTRFKIIEAADRLNWKSYWNSTYALKLLLIRMQ